MESNHCYPLGPKMPLVGQIAKAPSKDIRNCSSARSKPRKNQKVVRSRSRPVKRKTSKVCRKAERRGKSLRRGRSASRGKSKSKRHCMRPGPKTNNGFLNFMRDFRKNNCGLRPRDSISKGAQEWRSMSPACKAKYKKAGKRKPHRRSRSRSKSRSRSCKK